MFKPPFAARRPVFPPDSPLEGEELVAFVAERAMTLDELLDGWPAAARDTRPPAAALLQRWCRIFAAGERAALLRRLAWDGLDEEIVAAALAQPRHPAPPAYLCVLPEILAQPPSPPDAAAAAEVPFAHLLMPWVQHARRRLAALVPQLGTLFGPTARRAAERHLLEELSAVAAAALYEEFRSFCAAKVTTREPAHGDGGHLYRAFVDVLRGPALAHWLADHAVLAKHLCLLAGQWSDNLARMLARLASDAPALAEQLLRRPNLVEEPVIAFTPGLSDRHEGGQQVAILGFSDGSEVVYKPRDVTLEAAWRGLTEWLQARGLSCAPPAPAALARPGYGWVARLHCAEVENPREFARRAGALVFLAWLLGGADLHEDNLIATANGPAVVDAEALLQPTRADLNPAAATSIVASGLLTFPIITSGGEVVDAGGLVGTPRPSPVHRQWQDVNRDTIRPVVRAAPPRPANNLPRWQGQPFSPTRFPAELEEGFAAAYRFCRDHRAELLASDGPLHRFTAAAARIVLRPTESYVRLQRALLTPAYQRLGVERSIALDAINRPLAGSPQRPPLWPFARHERTALEQLDVPRFTVAVTAATLVTPSGEEIPQVIERSAWDSVRDRLRALDDQQLAEQRRLLTACARTQPLADERAQADTDELAAARAAWRDELVTAALASAEEIERLVFAGAQKANLALWAGLDPRDLYHGLPGVALFFAALHLATGEPRWRTRAIACWKSVLPAQAETEPALGACEGVGGRIYALAVLAVLLGDEEARAAARCQLGALTHGVIARDSRLDVAGGAAGAILALLAAYQVLGEGDALEWARRAALHLLKRQRPEGGWAARASAAPGFAHGAAGIACALARLAALTGDTRLGEAARRGFAFEQSLADARRGEWRAPARSAAGVRHVSMHAWCNGAPGIALALATSELPAAAQAGLAKALAATRSVGFSGLDHLCCGSLGIIDVLLTCGQRLEREPLRRAATARGVVVLRRARGSGGFTLDAQAERPGVRLGLFHGLAGTGYEALRLACPERLPSVLAFLPPGSDRPCT